jgi:aminomethyltransferase
LENGWFKFYFATWYKKSPYFQRTVEAGCTSWDVYNHMLIPTLYDDDVKEYWHLLEHVTLWDVAVERQVEITGPDAARFVQLLTPRDLSGCAVGQCKYVTICAPDGGIVNDPILLRLAGDRFWLSLADSDTLLYALGVQAFAGLDVQVREPDVSPLQVQGPKSKPLVRKLFGDDVADMKYYSGTDPAGSSCGTGSCRRGRSSRSGRSRRRPSGRWRRASSTTATTWMSRTTRTR